MQIKLSFSIPLKYPQNEVKYKFSGNSKIKISSKGRHLALLILLLHRGRYRCKVKDDRLIEV